MMMPTSRQSGQALLLVVLSMATISTLVLSVISRSISDIAITSQDEESLKAFSAAEAGIEQVLIASQPQSITGVVSNQGQSGQTSYDAQVSGFPTSTSEYVYPAEILAGDTASIWLVSHNAQDRPTCSGLPCYTASQLTLCWGKSGTSASSSTTPAVLVRTYYQSGSRIRTVQTALDPNAGRIGASKFTLAGSCPISSISGQSFAFGSVISFASIPNYTTAGTLKAISVRMLYNNQSQTLAARAGGAGILPSQGRQISSTGISGAASRKVEVYALYPDIPPVFSAALFSGGGITK